MFDAFMLVALAQVAEAKAMKPDGDRDISDYLRQQPSDVEYYARVGGHPFDLDIPERDLVALQEDAQDLINKIIRVRQFRKLGS